MRAFKTVNDAYIEPISFTVPRRAETFQSDIFPPATGGKAAMSNNEWLDGKSALPPKIDFESIYEGNAPVEVASDYKSPAAAPAPAPAEAAAAPEKPAQAKAVEPTANVPASRGPVPSYKDQNRSMAAMADKYNDNDDGESDNESSGFEEITKPTPRGTVQPASQPAPSKAPAAQPPKQTSPARTTGPTSTTTSAPSKASGAGVEESLEQIKKVLEQQTTMIASLTGEVESLKKRLGSGSQDQSERIRQLELELESLR